MLIAPTAVRCSVLRFNLAVLFLAQTISVTGSVSVVQLGGLVGLELAPREDLATLPLSLMVVGTALGTVLAAALMQAVGRRIGFGCGALIASGAMVAAANALSAGAFTAFCLAIALFGVSLAFTQQFRFAAAESVRAERASVAIGWVLFGSIGGAVLGPRLIQWAQREPLSATAEFVMWTLAVLLAGSALLFAAFYRGAGAAQRSADSAQTSTAGALWRRPGFALAVAAGATSYGVMTLVMTATPISMHAHSGHSMVATGWVIASHVVAMYLPSLFTGAIIVRVGCRPVMAAGIVALAASLCVGLLGHAVLHYWWSLVLLGLGWNFLFVGATTLLTRTYAPHERFRAQAINDFVVFGAAALASLLSGGLLYYVGWAALLLVPLPLLAMLLVGVMRANEVNYRTAPTGSGG